MIEAYKGRTLHQGRKVKVYFNLHSHLFSVQDADTGLVLAHGNGIMLEDITFKVSQIGRERVIREKKKNVHAFVIGRFIGTAESLSMPMRDAYYNPYKQADFTDRVSGRKLANATIAYLSDRQVKYL